MRLPIISLGLLAIVLASTPGQAAGPAAPATPGIKRTDLSRNALSTGGREALQVLVEFEPAVVAPRHSHPGEELVYVVEGALEYRLDGEPPIVLRAGEILFISKRRVHAVTNVNAGRSAELATYIVDPKQPLLSPADAASPSRPAGRQKDRK